MINIEKMILGPFQTNCYIVYDDEKNAVVIDPADNAEAILKKLDVLQLNLKKILLTHAHPDHVCGLYDIVQKKDVPVYLVSEDVEMLETNSKYFGPMLGMEVKDVTPDVILKDGDEITVGEMNFKVLHTPGHTEGSCCFLLNDKDLFSGDTLFYTSMGRVDLPGGSEEAMMNSLLRLSDLDKDIKVYPGHGPGTDIGKELRLNPYIQKANGLW